MNLNEYIKDSTEQKRQRDRLRHEDRIKNIDNEIKAYIDSSISRGSDYFTVNNDDFCGSILSVARKNGWVIKETTNRIGGVTYVVYFDNISVHRPVVINRIKNTLLVAFFGIIVILGLGFMTLSETIKNLAGQ